MPHSQSIDFNTDSAANVMALMNHLISLLKSYVPYSDVDIDALYNVGVQFYQAGKFENASNVFGMVNMFAPFNSLYLCAQAKCLKSLNAYEDAYEIFHLAWTLDQRLPESALHAAECLMLAGRKNDARGLIDEVLGTPAMSNQNRYLREKAEAWLTLLTGKK